jgi:hypothetical protein
MNNAAMIEGTPLRMSTMKDVSLANMVLPPYSTR